MVPTIKARLQNINRDLNRCRQRWLSTIEVFGGAYSEAFRTHTLNLPTQLPPNQGMIYLAKTAAGVLTLAGATVLAPVTVVVVFTGVSMAVEDFGNQLGQHRKPSKVTINLTPLNYQNRLKIYIRDRITDIQDAIDKDIEVVDGIRTSHSSNNIKSKGYMDEFEKRIMSSPLMYPPKNPLRWRNGNALEQEMEKFMWAHWALQRSKSAKKMIAAAKTDDMSKPFKRLQNLKVFRSSSTDFSGSGYKVQLAIAIQIIKWAKKYKPKKFGDPPSPAVRRCVDMFQKPKPKY